MTIRWQNHKASCRPLAPEELLHDLQTMTERKGIRTRNEVPHDGSIFADPMLIFRVFQNLLSNAIEYTDHREMTVGAAVSDADRVGFEIPAAVLLKSISEKCSTSWKGTEKTGADRDWAWRSLKQAIEAHGGEATVKSRPSEGSTFEFILPFENAERAPSSLSNGTAA